MATKILTVTMEIEISDLSERERAENADQFDDDDTMPGIEDVEPFEVADCIAGSFEIHSDEIFAGSNMFIKAGTGRVVSSDWKTP